MFQKKVIIMKYLENVCNNPPLASLIVFHIRQNRWVTRRTIAEKHICLLWSNHKSIGYSVSAILRIFWGLWLLIWEEVHFFECVWLWLKKTRSKYCDVFPYICSLHLYIIKVLYVFYHYFFCLSSFFTYGSPSACFKTIVSNHSGKGELVGSECKGRMT